MKKRTGMLGVLLLVMTSLIFVPPIKELASSEMSDSAGQDEEAATDGGISRFRSQEEILAAIRNFQNSSTGSAVPKAAASAQENRSMATADTASVKADYSGTNLQVQGVDEADIVKTDGTFLYHLNISRRELIISRAYPVNDFTVLSRTKLDEQFQPRDMFVEGKRIVVLGEIYSQSPRGRQVPAASEALIDRSFPVNSSTSILIYETDAQKQATLSRQFEMSGHYLSSRKLGTTLYIASNQSVYIGTSKDDPIQVESYLPMFRDTNNSQEFRPVETKDIYGFGAEGSNQYLNIATINLIQNVLTNPAPDFKLSSYLGGGGQVYMSEKNLYIARSDYPPVGVDFQTWRPSTTIYRFSAGNNALVYRQQGKVPGTLLNQFSMDEHDGFMRVATTQNKWREGSDNNLYVLDQQMNIAGKIEGLAKGERIYSVRFMGDRGFVVTYRNTDPLFTLDLQDARNPKVMGELKIPGFSNYLHPYDENHIIGFGRDTEERTEGGRSFVVQKGLKLSMFDVSDMTNPKEMFTTVVGDASTYSELQHNHKALLFSKEKNLFAFPVQEYRGGKAPFTSYHLFGIDMKNGFVAKGTIPTEQDPKFGFGQQRMVSIRDTLYLISDSVYKFNDQKTLQEVHTPIQIN